jgi:hypothetical protein
MNNLATKRSGNLGYFKNLEIEIREMDFKGMPLQQIADQVGLSVTQILEILDQIDDAEYNLEGDTK